MQSILWQASVSNLMEAQQTAVMVYAFALYLFHMAHRVCLSFQVSE